MPEAIDVTRIIRDAGGQVIGRTRLQKLAYLLFASGLGEDWSFSYKHYGPFSEDLATAARAADFLGYIRETEQLAAWGGVYSTYALRSDLKEPQASEMRQRLLKIAAAADAVVLELTATAVFLAKAGYRDPWMETARRKPEKADGDRLANAKALYNDLSQLPTPSALPKLVV
jgi:uncharacterized protein YwgA